MIMAKIKQLDVKTKLYSPLYDLINKCMEADQGNGYRKALGTAMAELEDAYQQTTMNFRSHLGASLIGKRCKRNVWYSFRWAREIKHTGRMIRLFNRGHLEEARFIALLQQAGLQTWFKKPDGGQFAFSNCDGYYGGSLDIVIKGVPNYEQEAFLCECKTHSQNSFEKLFLNGVAEAKPEHLIQMNQYMGHYNLKKAMYFAVNKNNDEIYLEVVEFNPSLFQSEINVANTVVKAKRPPVKAFPSKAYYACKNTCDYKDICWNNELPDRNCRTCEHSELIGEGKWACKLNGSIELSKDNQYNGCNNYSLLPQFFN